MSNKEGIPLFDEIVVCVHFDWERVVRDIFGVLLTTVVSALRLIFCNNFRFGPPTTTTTNTFYSIEQIQSGEENLTNFLFDISRWNNQLRQIEL